MNLALAVLCLWFGMACIYLGTHGLEASTPWGAFQTVLGNIRGHD